MDLNNLSDLELMAILTEARNELDRRRSAALDTHEQELAQEINIQRFAIGRVLHLREQEKLPVVQRILDRVLMHMEDRCDQLVMERENLRFEAKPFSWDWPE